MKGWKSVLYGLLIALVAIFSSPEVQAFVGQHLEWFGGITGAGIIILRALSDSPIFKKSADDPGTSP